MDACEELTETYSSKHQHRWGILACPCASIGWAHTVVSRLRVLPQACVCDGTVSSACSDLSDFL